MTLLASCFLAGCYTVPVTGRAALNLASDSEVARLSMAAFEELNADGLSSVAGASDRAKELEADTIGLIYMARAGYNPDAALAVLEKLDAISALRRSPPAGMSTHLSTPERKVRMIDNLSRAREVYHQTQNPSRPVIVQ